MSMLETLDRWVGRTTRVGSVLSSSVLMVVMFASIADAVGRWFLVPLEGVFEFNALLIGIVIFLGIPYAQRQRRHIAVTLLTGKLGPRATALLDAATLAFAALMFGWASVLFYGAAADAYVNHEVAQGVSRFPLFPMKLVMFLGILFLAIQLVLDVVALLRKAAGIASDKSAELSADYNKEHQL